MRAAPTLTHLAMKTSAAIRSPPAANRLDDGAMLSLHRSNTCASRRACWHGQHPQRVAGGRGVDDETIVGGRRCEPARLRGARRARRCRATTAAADARRPRVEPRAAERDLLEQRAARSPASARAPRGASISTACSEPRRLEPRRGAAPSGCVERIAEGRRGIGRNDERAGPARRGVQRDRGSAGRLADAALAADERKSGRVLPAQTVVVLVTFERGFDAGDPVVASARALRRRHPASDPGCRAAARGCPPRASSNSSCAHLTELDPHLCREQLFAQRACRRSARCRPPRRSCRSTNRSPPMSIESRRNMRDLTQCARSSFSRMLTKLYGGHGPGVLERQLVVALADVLDPRVERLLELAGDEERRVHDHPVADRLVRARRDRDVAQRLEDLRHVRSERACSAASIRRPYCMRAK